MEGLGVTDNNSIKRRHVFSNRGPAGTPEVYFLSFADYLFFAGTQIFNIKWILSVGDKRGSFSAYYLFYNISAYIDLDF